MIKTVKPDTYLICFKFGLKNMLLVNSWLHQLQLSTAVITVAAGVYLV